jgi:hypothetical protein
VWRSDGVGLARPKLRAGSDLHCHHADVADVKQFPGRPGASADLGRCGVPDGRVRIATPV